MSTEGQRNTGDNPGGETGSTVPDAPDGVAAGATGEPNTFEPEEAAPAAGTGGSQGTDERAPKAAGPAEELDRQEPDDRGLTTDVTPGD